jgi:hypothetical protein
MNARDIAADLDRAFAAAKVSALMGGVATDDTIDPLHVIHKVLKAKHAAGEMTDEQFTDKARELLQLLGNAAAPLHVRQNVSAARRSAPRRR